MGRLYTVEFEAQTIALASGDYELFYIVPADDKPVAIWGLSLDQISDVGEAQEEMLRYRVIRGFTAASSGGAAPTPAPLNPHEPASGFTARTCDTVVATTGTSVNLHSGAFNVRVGLDKWLPPECRWICTQVQTSLAVRLMAAVIDDLTLSGTIYVEEMT